MSLMVILDKGMINIHQYGGTPLYYVLKMKCEAWQVQHWASKVKVTTLQIQMYIFMRFKYLIMLSAVVNGIHKRYDCKI